jgi:zinc protease
VRLLVGTLLACGLLARAAAAGPPVADPPDNGSPGAGSEVGSEVGSGLDDPALRVQKSVLDNGLTVLMLPDSTTPVVAFQMWVKVGSRDETRFTGLAHLFEHMMFKGSKNIGPEEHARLVQARGGEVNAFTTRDQTVFFETVPSEALPLVIDLEGERVANLDISETTLTSERQVVIEERRMRIDDRPDGRAIEALYATLFEAHPYRWPVIGWRSDLEAMTVETCRDFFDTYYVPNNITIAIVGDFDPEAALARVERAFGGLVPTPIPRNPTREPEQLGERRAVVHHEVRSPMIAIAWHAPAAGDPDADALDVASVVLSGGRSSRLYRRLVYEEQQALGAQGGYTELADAGLFTAFAVVRPDGDVDRTEALLLEEIAKLGAEPISETELDKAKRQLEVDLVNGLTTNAALASRIASETLLFGRVRPLEERLEKIHAVTTEDVQRVARTYLVKDQRTVIRVVAPPDAGAGS